MNTQRLCPVYTKWLQLNPIDARRHRYFLQDSMQKARLQGQLEKACTLAYQTLEAAKLVLLALQNTSNHPHSETREDVISYSAAGMYLSSLLQNSHKAQEAHSVLQQCQQQLIAVLPLHATNHSILALIKTALHVFERNSLLLANGNLVNHNSVNNDSTNNSIHRAGSTLSLVH